MFDLFVKASKFLFEYQYFYGTSQNLLAKDELETQVQLSGVPEVFSFSQIYSTWENEAITADQLKQNIGLAMGCILLVSVVVLANIPLSMMIFFTVSLTLVDIIGFLHFLGISIDFIVITYIVISIGLCVDYAFHIGHAYLIQNGGELLAFFMN